MKISLIGMDIPVLLPSLLTDLLFAGHEAAELAVHESNPAMAEVLKKYMDAVIARSGLAATATVNGDRAEVLKGADAVIYAGDLMPASRFRMDREALSGSSEEDPGLIDQARVNGGLGGLIHTLRAGHELLELCDVMDEACPDALIVNLGQPVARTTAMLLKRGYRAYGLGRSPLKGANGIDTLCKKLKREPKDVRFELAGLTNFSWLLSLTDAATGADLLPQLEEMARGDGLGRLSRRWLDWYGALPVGDVTDHGEFLPEQEDFSPEENPAFGETVEQRKARILNMNTVGRAGVTTPEGAAAQLTLLSQAVPVRPVQLALALLRGEDLDMPAVTRRNAGELPQLAPDAVIEARLTLKRGVPQPHGTLLPQGLAEICSDVAETNRLAAEAAFGDRAALRECVETDPALAGLDRLYCCDVMDSLIRLHEDVLGEM